MLTSYQIVLEVPLNFLFVAVAKHQPFRRQYFAISVHGLLASELLLILFESFLLEFFLFLQGLLLVVLKEFDVVDTSQGILHEFLVLEVVA